MAGYFFAGEGIGRAIDTRTRKTSILEKFDAEPSVSRVLDSGNTVIYDVRPLRDADARN